MTPKFIYVMFQLSTRFMRISVPILFVLIMSPSPFLRIKTTSRYLKSNTHHSYNAVLHFQDKNCAQFLVYNCGIYLYFICIVCAPFSDFVSIFGLWIFCFSFSLWKIRTRITHYKEQTCIFNYIFTTTMNIK